MLHLLKNVELTRAAHHLRLAAQKAEPILKLFALGYRYAHA
jgi:hypothetical protein